MVNSIEHIWPREIETRSLSTQSYNQSSLTLTLRGSNPSVLRFDAPSAVLAAAERTVDRLWDRIGELMGAFFERDCQNFLTH